MLGKCLLIFSIVWAIFFFETFVSNIYENLREICATSGAAKLFQTSRVLSHYSRPFLGGHVIAKPGARQLAAN